MCGFEVMLYVGLVDEVLECFDVVCVYVEVV